MKNMATYRIFIYILLVGSLLLGACVQATPGVGSIPTNTPLAPTPTQPRPTQQPESTPTEAQMAAVQAAIQALAAELNLDPSQVSVVSFQQKEWSDSCLGLGRPDESCLQAMTPGVEGLLLANSQEYGFRADEAGQAVRIIPGAIIKAQQALAQKAGVKVEQVSIGYFEKVEWPDACLGVSVEGQQCAQVVTPGYRVMLNINATSYEYHTDESGGEVVPAAALDNQPNQGLVTWSQTMDGKCISASIGKEEVQYGACDGQQSSAPLSKARKVELEQLLQKFASFSAETVVGNLSFIGQGEISATDVQQRALAEWAKLVEQEAEAGRGAAAQGLAFAWHREGGIAGFCDDVGVYLTGFAYVTSCKGSQAQGMDSILLTSQQLHNLYWQLQQYQRFEAEDKDSATADSMTIHMIFEGTGSRETDPVVKDNLNALASELVAQASTLQNPKEIEAALQAFRDYYQALNGGDFAKAVELYGGSFDQLTSNNPDISPNDRAGLFQRACQQNGFQCDLMIKSIADQAQLSGEDYRFSVQFKSPNDSIFSQGPCCGASAEDMPPQNQFDFHVKKVGGKYLVMDLPVYVP